MSLHLTTPCLLSPVLSRRSGHEVWLKLENLQPSGSFKLRGMGAMCEQAQREGCRELVSSSGGNAGYSAAWAARELGLPIRVFLPEPTAPGILEALGALGAELELAGQVWAEAHQAAEAYVADHPQAALIHPFDHPTIWQGHASMIHEAAEQMPRPEAVILSVGGGGLMSGVLEGMHSVGWQDVPVWALETTGAASLAAAIQAGRPIRLEEIQTVARTLGASQVCDQAWEWTRKHPVRSQRVTDEQALKACRRFAQDTRLLVEPACGAALAMLYDHAQALPAGSRLLLIVCGGIDVYPRQQTGPN